MPSLNTNRWKTDPENIDLLNFLIERTENVESPMPIKRLAREFNVKSGVALTEKCFEKSICRLRTKIHTFDHIDTKSKVKLLFALSASVNAGYLKELKKDAVVEFDDKQRIIHYKSNDGSFELRGDHSRSAKISNARFQSKQSHRSLITSYYEKKNSADAIPTNEGEGEMGNLIEFIIAKCDKVNSPLSITRLAQDFVEKFRTSMPPESVRSRIKGYGLEIQRMEFVDTRSKVQQLFCLSATLYSDCLEQLRKNAQVEVDEHSRIVYYKANDLSLELRGDHSQSAKTKTTKLESKGSHPKLIRNYFENKNNFDAVPENDEEKEMWNLIGFIAEKCENIDSPLNIRQLVRDFNKHFGVSRSLYCIQRRTEKYCHEIQKAEFLDTPTKVKQLFGLGVTLDSDCLQKLRKDAVVEVDSLNRITKYTANDGCLTLYGDHSRSAKKRMAWIEWRRNKKRVKKHCSSDGDEGEDSEKENGYSEDDSDEYSSEEFGSEFDSDDENDHLNETEDLMEPSNEAVDFVVNTPIRNRSSKEISIDDNLDFDTTIETGEDQENDHGTTGNTSVKARSGRLFKRRHLDSAFSKNQLVNSSSSGDLINTGSSSSKPAKQKKIKIDKEVASNSSSQSIRSSRSMERLSRNSSFSTFSTESAENMEKQDATRAEDDPSDYHSPLVQGMEDYDYNPREDNIPESFPIDNRLEDPEPSAAKDHNPNIEAQNTQNRPNTVAPEPNSALQNSSNSTPQTNDENEASSPEVPIKVENEEPIVVEDPTEDVKPMTAHNPKIKFFEAMQSLILFLDTPSLSNLRSKIQQRARKIKGSKEVLQNNELIPAMQLLVARMTNHSVMDISDGVESVSLIQFFCYLKASILNSKIIGVEVLTNYISRLIEKSQNKRIPMKKVVNALRATLDIDDF